MLKIDTHVHSIASGHAFNTIHEIAKEANEKEVELIAVTDHGPDMKGAPHAEYFSMSERIPKNLYGVDILFGCEANIINVAGDIDLDDKIIRGLDILLVGFHDFTSYRNNGIEHNTEALLNAMKKYPIDIITHPYRPQYPIFVDKVARYAAEANILLELNNSIFNSKKEEISPELLEKTKEMIRDIKKYEGKSILGSDAHIVNEIGSDSAIKYLWNDLGVDGLDIIYNKEEFKSFLNKKKKW